MNNLHEATDSSEQHCPLCNSPTKSILTNKLRRGPGTVYYCNSCRHGFLCGHEIITDIKDYYSTQYRQEYSHSSKPSSTNAEELFNVYTKYQTSRLSLISPLLHADTTVLEVGASAGQFIAHILPLTKHIDAIELDIDCANYIKSTLPVNVDTAYLEDSIFADKQYDVTCCFQVIEHVPNPKVFLSTLINSLKPGGTLFLELPNLRDPLLSVWDVHAYNSFYYHSAHLHYFTEHSMSCILSSLDTPITNVSVHYTQDYNILNHLNWILTDKPQSDCHVGLGPINFRGHDEEIANWLSDRLSSLNQEYFTMLSQRGLTSNIMFEITK